jgi:hypothetical protein
MPATSGGELLAAPSSGALQATAPPTRLSQGEVSWLKEWDGRLARLFYSMIDGRDARPTFLATR